jgi:MSHA biogenesis protein MshK
MDEAVKRWSAAALVALAGAAWQLPVVAQVLRDPTQPPPMVAPAQAGAVEAHEAVSNEPQLQSVLISNRVNGRRVAVIDGETVRVGDTFRDAKVVRISLNEVVLRQGKTDQVLVMRPVSTARAASSKPEADQKETVKAGAAKPQADRLEELLNAKPRPQ